jgi:uncharacterized membrane protein
MNRVLSSASASLAAGFVLAGLFLLISLVQSGADRIGFISFLLRWVHILGAIAWLGMILFVNFIQIAAVAQADEAGKKTLMQSVVPRVAAMFRHASHLTLLSGVLLLITTGYILDSWVFLSAVYIPTSRSLLMWSGVLGGLIMWLLVHFAIWPNLQIVLGEQPGDAAAKAAARERVHICARINLVLAIPVTFVMVAATHLF